MVYIRAGLAMGGWAYDGDQVLCRSGDSLYSLGGANGDTYDSTVEVQMPFLDAGKPADSKDFTGDVTCTNEWNISVATTRLHFNRTSPL